jgi:hypothetical protein
LSRVICRQRGALLSARHPPFQTLGADSTLMRRRSAPASHGGECCKANLGARPHDANHAHDPAACPCFFVRARRGPSGAIWPACFSTPPVSGRFHCLVLVTAVALGGDRHDRGVNHMPTTRHVAFGGEGVGRSGRTASQSARPWQASRSIASWHPECCPRGPTAEIAERQPITHLILHLLVRKRSAAEAIFRGALLSR